MAHHTTHVNVCEGVTGLLQPSPIYHSLPEACPRATIAVSIPIACAVIVAIGYGIVIAVIFDVEQTYHIRTIELVYLGHSQYFSELS